MTDTPDLDRMAARCGGQPAVGYPLSSADVLALIERVKTAEADRDRAVREALENAAQKIREAEAQRNANGLCPLEAPDACLIVERLIPEADLGVWTQEQVDSINERAARRAEALAPLIEGDTE